MGERINAVFPFVIAVVLPPAGVLLGLTQIERERDLGIRLIVVSVVAAVVWALLILSA